MLIASVMVGPKLEGTKSGAINIIYHCITTIRLAQNSSVGVRGRILIRNVQDCSLKIIITVGMFSIMIILGCTHFFKF